MIVMNLPMAFIILSALESAGNLEILSQKEIDAMMILKQAVAQGVSEQIAQAFARTGEAKWPEY